MLGAIALLALPAIFALVRRDELSDAVAKTPMAATPSPPPPTDHANTTAKERTTMTTTLSDKTTIVVGASRGLGRGIATAFAQAGAPVIAVARNAAALAELAELAGGDSHPARGRRRRRPDGRRQPARPLRAPRRHPGGGRDAADAPAPAPDVGDVLASTGTPTSGSRSTGCARRCSSRCGPAARVVVISSGAAVQGSPLSGGYAGAKATQRFIAAYARDEAERAGSGDHVHRGAAPDHAR